MSESPSRVTEVKEQIEQAQAVLAQAHRAIETFEHAEFAVKRAGKRAKGGFGRLVIVVALLGGGAYAANKYLINSASREGDNTEF